MLESGCSPPQARHARLANRTIKMISSCGFDSVPADLSAFAVADYINTKLSARTGRVDYSVHEIKGSASGGTILTSLNTLERYSLSQLAKIFSPFSLAPRLPNRTRPEQKPSVWARFLGLRKVLGLGWMGINPQGIIDRALVGRSWGLLADDDDQAYGENFDFQAWMRMPGPVSAVAWHLTLYTALALLCMPPVRWLLKKAWFKSGDGPDEAFRSKCSFVVRTRAAVDGGDGTDGKHVEGKMTCGIDPYTFTGVSLAETALLLARDMGVQTKLQGGGLLTTALLGRELLESLGKYDFKIEVKEVV